mmetsp:Transcript_13571/g.17783  ORF Transcript_13571/g.17783 Transcript_13571/m.17783 type:complete len:312 (+) Transcript_13571:62-997(+)
MNYHLTYLLGRTIYIPLTHRTQYLNRVTSLPESRGPGFLLPKDVVSVLQHVRSLEGCCSSLSIPLKSAMEDDGAKVLVRDYLPRRVLCRNDCDVNVVELERKDDDDEKDLTIGTVTKAWSSLEIFENESSFDAFLCEGILEEVACRLSSSSSSSSSIGNIDGIAFAGEGEPTLKPAELLYLSQKIRNSFSSLQKIRLVTNGIVHESSAELFRAYGINSVSVALMTSDAICYEKIMGTSALGNNLDTRLGREKLSCHNLVCRFIASAVKNGLDVEVTGVQRADVDTNATNTFVKRNFGDRLPIRWRPYFSEL